MVMKNTIFDNPYKKEIADKFYKMYLEHLRDNNTILERMYQQITTITAADEDLELASGPVRCKHVRSEVEEWYKTQNDLIELSKQCCKICGVHLETNEINNKMRCSICYNKKIEDE